MSSPDPNFDARLDAELRDVAVPAGLLERLRRIAALRDEELDALLGDVPVPAELEPRLLRIGRRAERWLRVRRAALAASLLVGLGIGYFAAVLGELATMRGGVARRGPALTAQIALQGRQEQPGDSAAEGVWIVAQEKHPSAEPTAEPMPPAPEVALGAESPADNSPLAETRRLFAGRENPAGLDPLGDRVLQEWPHVLAGPSRLDDLPEFREVPGLKARGVAMPLVPQYDHGFEIRFGVHPFAVPAANPQLRSSLVPLAVDTASYDLARKLLQGGELPPRGAVRTEEFLAAIDYQFPAPTGSDALALYLAGSADPFRADGRRLLQVGVRARDLPDVQRPGTRLTIAVDVSASMDRAGRLDMVRRALNQFWTRLGQNDRITLVPFAEYGYVLLEDGSREGADQLVAAADALTAGTSTNLADGLRYAYAAANRSMRDKTSAHRVVVLTDGGAQMDAVSATAIEKRLGDAAASGIVLNVVDMGSAAQDGEVDPLLARFARAGGGRILRAGSADQVRWALQETLTGKSQVVASDVQLRVTFNEKSVILYRLYGHEIEAVAKPAPLAADFCAGQAATALYEIELFPKGESNVATVELAWRDPQSGQPRRLVRRIRREQFAGYWQQAPLPLQAASVVAEVAETLRGVPEVWPLLPHARMRSYPESLLWALEVARQTDTRVRDNPSFAEFMAMLEKACTARPYRSGGSSAR